MTRPQVLTRVRRILDQHPQPTFKASRGWPVSIVATGVPAIILIAALCTKTYMNESVAQRPAEASSTESSSRTAANTALAIVKAESFQDSFLANEYPTIRGLVRDTDGNPVNGATVIILEHPYNFPNSLNKNGTQRTRGDLQVLAQAKTSLDGEFDLHSIQIPKFKSYLDSPFPISLVILHKDHAIYWDHLDYIPNRRVDCFLPKPDSVSFEITSLDVASLKNVKVELDSLMTLKDWNDGVRYDWPVGKNISKGIVLESLGTVAEQLISQNGSRVTVDRIPDNCIAVVRITADDYLDEIVSVANVDMAEQAGELKPDGNKRVIPSLGEAQLQPAAKMSLKVVDDVTGKPVSKAQVFVRQFNDAGQGKIRFAKDSTTDETGESILKGFDPKQSAIISVIAPDNSNLLNYRWRHDSASLFENDKLEIRLLAGIEVQGRVVDQDTADPIADVPIRFVSNNRNQSPEVSTQDNTNSKGEFRLFVPKESGSIQPLKSEHSYQTRIVDNDSNNTKPVSIDCDPTLDQLDTFVLKLKKSPEVEQTQWLSLTVNDENGTPKSDAKVRFYGLNNNGGFGKPPIQMTDENGTTKLNVSQMLFRYRKLGIVVIDEANHLAGVTVFEPDKKLANAAEVQKYIQERVANNEPNQPAFRVDIQLQKMIKVSGTIVDFDEGNPIAFAQVKLLQKTGDDFNILENFSPIIETDEQGRFEINIVPNLTTYPRFEHAGFLQSEGLHEIDLSSVMPGETLTTTHRLVTKTTSPNADIQQIVVPATDNLTPVEAFELLKREFKNELQAFRESHRLANTPEEKLMIIRRRHPSKAYLKRMLEIADENVGKPVEAKALAWACDAPMHTSENLTERYKLRSLIGNRLLESHLGSSEIEGCLANLIYSQSNSKEVCEQIINNNPHRSVQGKTTFELAKMYLRHAGRPKRVDSLVWLKDMSDEQLEAESAKLLKTIKADYADIPYWRKENLGNMAEQYLFELEHLGVGDVVADINGFDLDEIPMSLSDFRGKIVVLDFWGSWCAPCIGDIPKLNQIAEDFPDDVVVVGFMTDTPADAKTAIDQHDVKWRNWSEAEEGPVQTLWNINSWPTTYVISGDGKILAKHVRGEKLYSTVEALVNATKSNR